MGLVRSHSCGPGKWRGDRERGEEGFEVSGMRKWGCGQLVTSSPGGGGEGGEV